MLATSSFPISAYKSLQQTGCAPLLLGASVFGRAENRRLSAGIGNERQLQSSNRIEFLVQTKQTDSVPPLQAGDFAQFLQAFNAGLGQNAQSAGQAVDMRLLTTLSPSAIPSSAPTMRISASAAPSSDPSTLPSSNPSAHPSGQPTVMPGTPSASPTTGTPTSSSPSLSPSLPPSAGPSSPPTHQGCPLPPSPARLRPRPRQALRRLGPARGGRGPRSRLPRDGGFRPCRSGRASASCLLGHGIFHC